MSHLTPTASLPIPLRALILGALALLLGGCQEKAPTGLSELAQQGKVAYQNVCIACHNGNPALDGAVGPANAGASLALLEAKIMRGEYPAGYTPKRATQAMPKFDYLKEQIPALHAYLQEVPQ